MFSSDCPPSEQVDPRVLADRLNKSGRRRYSLFEGVDYPIELETTDEDDVKGFFKSGKFIPFAGNQKESGHKLLNLLKLVADFSPLNSACVGKKNGFAFGSTATTIRYKDPEFSTGDEKKPLTPAEREMYRLALKDVRFDRPTKQFAQKVGADFQDYGNAWIKVAVSKVNGQAAMSLNVVPVENALYVATEKGQDKYVGICSKWSATSLHYDEKDVEILPLWPNYTEEDGVLKSIMHLRNGGRWYGRPQSMGGLLPMYEAMQTRTYRIQQTHGDFSGRLIIETEADDPAGEGEADDHNAQSNGYNGWSDEFSDNYTNAGKNRKGIMHVTRPVGSSPMFVFPVPANANGGYFTDIDRMNAADILAAHGVTPRFMGLETSGRYAQNNAFLEDYVLNVEPTINSLRHTICVFINQALTDFWKITGREFLNEQSLWFNGPIDKQVEMFRETMGQPQGQTPNNDINAPLPV